MTRPIKYKNFEWSFACKANDFAGHKDRSVGKEPHFHFQMRIDNRPFIDYGNYHIPLIDYDFFIISIKQNKLPGVTYRQSFGPGINQLINDAVETDLHGMKIAENEEDAQFHMGTIIKANPGTTFSGDELEDLMEESRQSGVPIASLAHRLKNVSVITTIEPGPGVAVKAQRTRRKSR